MATFRAVILRGQRHTKADGTTNVKIRITHRRQNQYISTDLYVTPDDWNNGLTSDEWINSRITDYLATYNHRYLRLGDMARKISALELKKELMHTQDHAVVDFWEFTNRYLGDLERLEKTGSLRGFRGVVSHLRAFRQSLKFHDIDRPFLDAFEGYMRRQGVRGAIPTYMGRLRLLFNAGRRYYNDEDRGIIRIPHYPFRSYKIMAPRNQAQHKALTSSQLHALISYAPLTYREYLGRDTVIIMICLMGINAGDLYRLERIVRGRITYNRSKTGAPLSVAIQPELQEMITRYRGDGHIFRFSADYANHEIFTSNVNRGLRSLITRMHEQARREGEKIDLPEVVTTNWIRHSFATIARNECGYDRDTVGKCLGHDDRVVTDAYIKPDYTIVDNVCRAVLDRVMIPQLTRWEDGNVKGHRMGWY